MTCEMAQLHSLKSDGWELGPKQRSLDTDSQEAEKIFFKK